MGDLVSVVLHVLLQYKRNGIQKIFHFTQTLFIKLTEKSVKSGIFMVFQPLYSVSDNI